jgi:hypothetical protein
MVSWFFIFSFSKVTDGRLRGALTGRAEAGPLILLSSNLWLKNPPHTRPFLVIIIVTGKYESTHMLFGGLAA